jgi:hypothetical protein
MPGVGIVPEHSARTRFESEIIAKKQLFKRENKISKIFRTFFLTSQYDNNDNSDNIGYFARAALAGRLLYFAYVVYISCWN